MSAERPKNPEGVVVPGMEQFEVLEALYEGKKIPQESPESCEHNVAELESQMEEFTDRYNLDLLHSIGHITTEERRTHPMREPARADLRKIFELLMSLETQDAVSDEIIATLTDTYEQLDQAVGTVIEFTESGNEFIDHTRKLSRTRKKK